MICPFDENPVEYRGQLFWWCPECRRREWYHGGDPPYRHCHKLGWGDRLKKWMGKMGLTKSFYARLRGYGSRQVIGGAFTCQLARSPYSRCGCSQRQERLNQFGRRVRQFARRWRAKCFSTTSGIQRSSGQSLSPNSSHRSRSTDRRHSRSVIQFLWALLGSLISRARKHVLRISKYAIRDPRI